MEKVDIPEQSRGPWTIARFTVAESDAARTAISMMQHGRGYVPPGTYTKLVHEKRGIVMSDTPDEMNDHWEAKNKAKGNVLIAGLGVGMVLKSILAKPAVTSVTVVEIDPDIVAMVAPHYACDRLQVVNESIFDFMPPKGVRYDVAWYDIWDSITANNVEQMTKLKRRFGRRADWQGCWAEWRCRKHLAQDRKERAQREWWNSLRKRTPTTEPAP